MILNLAEEKNWSEYFEFKFKKFLYKRARTHLLSYFRLELQNFRNILNLKCKKIPLFL